MVCGHLGGELVVWKVNEWLRRDMAGRFNAMDRVVCGYFKIYFILSAANADEYGQVARPRPTGRAWSSALTTWVHIGVCAAGRKA